MALPPMAYFKNFLNNIHHCMRVAKGKTAGSKAPTIDILL